MALYVRNEIVIGDIGSGKTLLLMDSWDRIGGVMWDPCNDMPRPSWAVEADTTCDPLAVETGLRHGWRILFRAGDVGRPALSRQVARLVSIVRRTGSGLWVDESHLVCPQVQQGSQTQYPAREALLTAMRIARHDDCSYGLASQDPQTLAKDAMRVGAPTIRMFKTALSEQWFRAYGVPEEVQARLREAPPHSYIDVAPDKSLSDVSILPPSRLTRFAA